MKHQLQLFQAPGTETAEKITRLLTGVEPGQREMGIRLAEQNNFPLSGLLIRHIKTAYEKDFKKVWDGFELNGEMVYYNYHFGRAEFKLYEDDGSDVYLNNCYLYTVGENDTFGRGLTEKYVRVVVFNDQL